MPGANFGPDPMLAQMIGGLQRDLRNFMTSPILLNASTGSGIGQPAINIDQSGVHAYNASGQNIVGMLTSDGSVTAYDASGNPVARFGPLINSNPGNYGIEVKFNGAWVQVGAGNVDWANISNKPTTFTPATHASTHGNTGGDRVTIDGTQVTTGAVPDASGSSYGYNHAVGGTSFFAAWFGNDAGNHFGTNTSSARYKANVRRHRIDPQRVLNLRPVAYEKPANDHYTEYGLIAEQVLEAGVPELVQWMDGKVHGLRYDLLAVALLEVVKEQERRIAALERGETHIPAKPWHAPEHKANNPPPHPEEPHPYQIRED